MHDDLIDKPTQTLTLEQWHRERAKSDLVHVVIPEDRSAA